MKKLSFEILKFDVKNCWALTCMSEREVQLADLINKEYLNNNKMVVKNSFFKYTAILHYNSAILKLYSLFGDYTWSNKNSFHKYVENKQNWPNGKDIEDVENILKQNSTNTVEIGTIRHKLIAHHDFDDFPKIHYNVEHLDSLKEMVISAKSIIKILASNTDSDFGYFIRDPYLNHFEHVLKSIPEPKRNL